MKQMQVKMVIYNKWLSFVFVDSRKMIYDTVVYIFQETDKDQLKRFFPHATILDSEHPQVSNRDKGAVKAAIDKLLLLTPEVIDTCGDICKGADLVKLMSAVVRQNMVGPQKSPVGTSENSKCFEQNIVTDIYCTNCKEVTIHDVSNWGSRINSTCRKCFNMTISGTFPTHEMDENDMLFSKIFGVKSHKDE